MRGFRKEALPPRVLGGLGSFAIVAGSMIGGGIFLAPPIAAQYVGSSWQFLLIWLVGGISALGGAVACGELAVLFPQSGGDYIFQREAFGPSVAFASGFMLLAAVFAGSIAALAVGLCTYQLPIFLGLPSGPPTLLSEGPFSLDLAQVIALCLVAILTAVNALGARSSSLLQVLVVLLPIAAMTLGSLWGLISGAPAPLLPAVAKEVRPVELTAVGFVSAYLPIYFAYSGWNGVIYLAGEVEQPTRNLPRALVCGTLVVTGLYTLMCLGYLRVLGLDGLRGVVEAGSASAAILAGPAAAQVFAGVIGLALIASLNSCVLSGARVAYAMACGQSFWAGARELHPTLGVPSRALWFQAGWAGLLILSNSFEQILAMVSVAMVISGTLTVSALFVLRWRRPELPRHYGAFGYPWLPLVYLVANVAVIGIMVGELFSGKQQAAYPLLGLAILSIAFGFHRLRNRERSVLPHAEE